MTFPIKYLSLNKAELEYEVELRGGTPGTVLDLRKQIVPLAEKLPADDISVSHLSAEVDLLGAKESLLKALANITSLNSEYDRGLYYRTEAILHHVSHRLDRICPEEAQSDVLQVCRSNLAISLDSLKKLSHQTRSHTVAEKAIAIPNITVKCEKSLTSDLAKLKYAGKTCVRAFIQRVDEYVIARGVSSDMLVNLAYEIFSDDALHWYRRIKDSVSSWSDIVEALKRDFSVSDYDYRLLDEIRARTQGVTENITVYVSIMEGIFSRLSKALSEDDKLEILLHNIRPFYATSLAASPAVKSIESLITICRNSEIFKARVSHFHEPLCATASTLAPDLAFKKAQPTAKSGYATYNRPANNVNVGYENNYQNNRNFVNSRQYPVSAVDSNYQRHAYCPRCRTDKHSLGECRAPHFPICFKCGKGGVRTPDCPDCRSRYQQKN